MTLDCQRCGACCTDPAAIRDGVLAFVSARDVKRLPKRLVREVNLGEALGEAKGLAANKHGRCLALRGRIGRAVVCSVYADRPSVCRRFKPASNGCLHARADAGFAS